MSVDQLVEDIIVREGGFVNDPADKGGATKFGVTQATLAEHRGHPVSVDEVKNLSLTEARDIYRERYYLKPAYHLLGSEALQGVMVDFAVHSGPVTATKALQRVLGLPDDGIMGGETMHAANLKDGSRLGIHVLTERQRYLVDIVVRNPSQLKFLRGWTDRVMDQIEALS